MFSISFQIPLFRVELVGNDFREVKIFAYDARNRQHSIHLFISDKGIEKAETQFPNKVDLLKNSLKHQKIDELYHSFCEELSNFQMFWDELDEIDRHCWVIEPPPSTIDRSASYRRIALSNFRI